MKIQIDIPDDEIKERVVSMIAEKMVELLIDGDSELGWEEQKKDGVRRRNKILDKINWSKATTQLNNEIVKKFFEKAFNK